MEIDVLLADRMDVNQSIYGLERMDMNQSMEWIYNLSYEELLVLVGALIGFVKLILGGMTSCCIANKTFNSPVIPAAVNKYPMLDFTEPSNG